MLIGYLPSLIATPGPSHHLGRGNDIDSSAFILDEERPASPLGHSHNDGVLGIGFPT